MKSIALFLIIFSFQSAHAQEEKSFIDKVRPQLVSLIGEHYANKILGKEKKIGMNEVEFPAIPNVEISATSVAVYNRAPDAVKLNWSSEEEKKYNYIFVRELFEATRQTRPNENDVGKIMNVLSQGGTREGVYRSLVLDSVYAGMENWERPVKSVTADFAVYFYEKYLGRSIQKKSLEGMSIYSLKRLMTERALEVATAFEEDRDGLERWYGVMSSDLATRFPQIWPNEMRKNESALAHKNWASVVPLQHIKSEMIIKLHSALNSMI